MFRILTTSILLLTALATTIPAEAQSVSGDPVVSQSYKLTPRKLITMARHGRFKAQGIPSHSNFGNSIRSGRITAESLVQSAIDNKRLPENAMSDRKYLKAVENHLKSGGCGSV